MPATQAHGHHCLSTSCSVGTSRLTTRATPQSAMPISSIRAVSLARGWGSSGLTAISLCVSLAANAADAQPGRPGFTRRARRARPFFGIAQPRSTRSREVRGGFAAFCRVKAAVAMGGHGCGPAASRSGLGLTVE
jgi:hypothetical protein